MREKALKNAPGGKLPEGFHEVEHAPPPPPSAVEDSDILDLSMELNAASIDEVQGDLDTSGIERVPNADPGFDRPFPEVNQEHSPTANGPHVRRKSVLPVDPSVIRDLQAHRSLDDKVASTGGGSGEGSGS